MLCKSLRELTLGIIGLDNIGKTVAKRDCAFGMKILGLVHYMLLPLLKIFLLMQLLRVAFLLLQEHYLLN